MINNFDVHKAQSNMAAYNDKSRWMCKAGSWECPYMRPFKYFAIRNAEGNVVRSSLKREDLSPGPDEKVVVLSYEGCPAHRQYQNVADEL